MTNEMIERAARALCELHHSEVDVGAPLEEYWEQNRETFILDAQTVLRAAVEPERTRREQRVCEDMGMLGNDAGQQTYAWGKQMNDLWKEIDQAYLTKPGN